MAYLNHKPLRQEVCDAIYMVIPEVPRLVQLFHNWSNLDHGARANLDKEVLSWQCPERKELYLALTDAFSKWEHIQATEGAPGCDPKSFEFSSNAHLEQQLLCMIQNLEIMVNSRNEENEVHYSDINENQMIMNNTEASSNKRRALHKKNNLFVQDVKRTHSLSDLSGYHTD